MLTTAMMSMRGIVKEIKESSFDWDVTVIVGGAPITRAFADEIGVEYADNAIDCMDKILNKQKNN